jgi:uncharacterized lipoprotein YajG
VRRIALGAAFLGLAGCVGDTNVRVPAAARADGPNALASVPALRVKVVSIPDREVRGRSVGERTAAFGVSMGGVAITQDVGATVRGGLAEDLRAAGHGVVETGQDVTVTDAVRTLDVHTNTTMLYWDVVGRVGVAVTVEGVGAPRELEYLAERTERTYVFPGKALMARVVGDCLEDVRRQMRRDAALADALRAATARY